MLEPLDDEQSAVTALKGQLSSWKEIAGFFNRDVTTVQRWEKREGMPVHRHLHDKIGSVYAFRLELAAWSRSRNLREAAETSSSHPSAEVETSATDTALPLETFTPPARLRRPKFFLRQALVLALAGAAIVIAATVWFRRTDYFWRNPLEGARFQTVTDFGGVDRDATLSRDGHLVAFLSDHDGQMDVWITQIGSGEFHNLTRGSVPELVNPSVRTLSFSADSSLVLFWARRPGGSKGGGIGIWAVPTLGGKPRPYLEGVAELEWSHDGRRLAYHTPGPGDPLFVSDGLQLANAHLIFTAPAGSHSHFPTWSPDNAFIYVVRGSLPDQLDIWRIAEAGGTAERITSHSGGISYPALLDDHTMIYVATDPDGSGPWLYGMNVATRIAHRLTSGPDRYTSVAASANGTRLVLTLATPKRTLWRLPMADLPEKTSSPTLVPLATSAGFSPRIGPNYLLYVSSTDASDSIWKIADGSETELWSAAGARVLAAPAISADGQSVAFSIRQSGRSRLLVMRADGTEAHTVEDGLDLEGAPAWAPDGRSITLAANEQGSPRLFRFPVDRGAAASFVHEYSIDPVWMPNGRFAVYSGADIGTTFMMKAVKADGTAQQIPAVTLTRGARHVVFASGGRSLIFLRGEIKHKDVWAVDLQSGAERQVTRLPADFDVREFDLSADGRELVLERVQERSDIVLVDLPRH